MLESFSGVRKILFCGAKCNLNSNCRYFDYDASTRVCRTFLRGKVVASQFLTKQVGTINDIDFLYMSYGSACSPNNYEGNRYLKCNTSNLYQCHDRFSWNGSACIAKDYTYNWNRTGTTIAGITNSTGTSMNLLDHPMYIAVDAEKSLFISDCRNHRIQKWYAGAPNGITIAGDPSSTLGYTLSDLNYPADTLIDSKGGIYISDTGNHRVVYWIIGASSGVCVAGTGVSGSGFNQLWQPHGLAIEPVTNALFIADTLNHRIMQYNVSSTSGLLIAGGNGAGSSYNQLNYPRGIVYDATTTSLYIANTHAHNVVRWVLGTNSWVIFAGNSGGNFGSGSQSLYFPTTVVFDHMGNFYVSDEGNQRIQFFHGGRSNGTTIVGVTNRRGSNETLLSTPSSVAIDDELNIYVSDYDNARIQKFDLL